MNVRQSETGRRGRSSPGLCIALRGASAGENAPAGALRRPRRNGTYRTIQESRSPATDYPGTD